MTSLGDEKTHTNIKLDTNSFCNMSNLVFSADENKPFCDMALLWVRGDIFMWFRRREPEVIVKREVVKSDPNWRSKYYDRPMMSDAMYMIEADTEMV